MLTNKEISHRYYIKHKIEILRKARIYYLKYKKEILQRNTKYNKIHKEKIKTYNKNFNAKYYMNNKKRINDQRNIYFKNRKKQDIIFKLLCKLRTRISVALKGNPKLETTTKLVGCSIEKLKQHLESKFTKGMSFLNYGKWHVDHIRPCVSFNLSKVSEQKKCFNYKNLQPLWAKDNFKKWKNYA